LLAEFARSESEPAFATLAARHVNLVHSAALRFTGNPHHAQEITQAVFLILARKAGSISRKTILSGWLYQTARLTAANFVKAETRRQQREQEAYMQSTLNEPSDMAWQQIAPLLDEAMSGLGETDRNAVVLRFFENKTAQQVGAALRLTEAAAHKRTARALDKLRKFFSKRGVTLSATVIAGAVATNSVQAAPMGLAAMVAATAAKGAGISATLTTLVKGTMKTI
jgi:RNA polymerase sigma factor (sigma-70 family)